MPLADAWEGLLTPRLYREGGGHTGHFVLSDACGLAIRYASTAYVSPRHSFSSGFQERNERRDSFPI
jgi:hypothetical protein